MKIDRDEPARGLKEWSLICDALESGRQSVILRKGGIAEGRQGFDWKFDRFFLFPTHFHEQASRVRLEEKDQDESQGVEGFVSIRLFVETLSTARVNEWEEVERLEPFHVWTWETVRDRFHWGDSPGLFMASVRVSRLAEPWVLADRPAFRGCRSWIDLPEAEAVRERWDERIEIEPACGRPDWL